MIKTICSICQREQQKMINDGKDEVVLSHGLCVKCSSTDEEYLFVPIKKILDSKYASDEEVISAINFIKEGIASEIKRGVVWIGKEKEYSTEAAALYEKYRNEVESEITSEALKERGPIR